MKKDLPASYLRDRAALRSEPGDDAPTVRATPGDGISRPRRGGELVAGWAGGPHAAPADESLAGRLERYAGAIAWQDRTDVQDDLRAAARVLDATDRILEAMREAAARTGRLNRERDELRAENGRLRAERLRLFDYLVRVDEVARYAADDPGFARSIRIVMEVLESSRPPFGPPYEGVREALADHDRRCEGGGGDHA
jgi:hypothetical protein